MALITLQAPESLPENFSANIINGEITVDESETLNYYQFGFYAKVSEPKLTVLPIAAE